MKKNILKVALVAIFAFFAGYGVYINQKSTAMSDLALVNVEALATPRETDNNCRTNTDYTSICNYYDNGAICPCGF